MKRKILLPSLLFAVISAGAIRLLSNPGNITKQEAALLSTSYAAIEEQIDSLVRDTVQLGGGIAQQTQDLQTEIYAYEELLKSFYLSDRDTTAFSWEDPAFQSGGDFEWMKDPNSPGEFEKGGWDSIWNAGWMSSQVIEIPTNCSNRKILFNNEASSWGEHGPKWGIRAYNVFGEIRNLTMQRVGDFSAGREGHGIYLNVFGNLLLDNVSIVDSGGQFAQMVWRSGETKIPQNLWLQSSKTVTIRNSTAINCGSINEGNSVRASWPLAFYNPGQSLVLENFTVQTKFRSYNGIMAHGGVFVGPGQEYRSCPSATITDLSVEVWASDRAELVLWNVADAQVIRPNIVDHGGTADISIVDDCGKVLIQNPTNDLVVRIYTGDPFRSPIQVISVRAGETFRWSK